jgi:DNA-binding NarL/FixJ family response regulator
VRLIVAVHGREVKGALFLALNGLDAITIVATATSTGELTSYCRSFKPDVIIFERGLPGRPAAEVLPDLRQSLPECRIQMIDESGGRKTEQSLSDVEIFTDLDQLIAAYPELGANQT